MGPRSTAFLRVGLRQSRSELPSGARLRLVLRHGRGRRPNLARSNSRAVLGDKDTSQTPGQPSLYRVPTNHGDALAAKPLISVVELRMAHQDRRAE